MKDLVSPGVGVVVTGCCGTYPEEIIPTSGIYVASRASIPERSAMWRERRALGWNIISTWIDEAGEGETESFEDLWGRIAKEVKSCDYFILYAEKDDFPLKGALVETGMALAYGKPIIVVLNFELEGRTYRPIGSWITHPLVHIVATVQEALDMAAGITTHPIYGEWEVKPRNMDEDIELWAQQLAQDSVECGEAEYGLDYPSNKN
jgi:hypothetical protein